MRASALLFLVSVSVLLAMTSCASAYTIPSDYPGYFIPTDFRIQSSYIVKPGETFQVAVKGNGPSGWSGGLHIHWLSSEAEYVSTMSENGGVINFGNSGDYSYVECDGPYRVSCTVTLRALKTWGESIGINYRGWDWKKEINCGDDSYDYMRVPSSGICSSNCKNFPEDVIVCDSYSKSVPIQGCLRKGTLSISGEPSLPDGIWQEGDIVSVNYKGSTCTQCSSPISIRIEGVGCSHEYEITAKTATCITSDPGYSSVWTVPEIPSDCLGKDVILTATVEGMSESMEMELSSDNTRDERPEMGNFGDFSKDSYYVNEMVTYTATASDDKGLAEIDILASVNGDEFEVVKTCQVSGTSASCEYSGGPYDSGTEVCMYANARDVKSQEPYGWKGTKESCTTVCQLPVETDNGLEYDKNGTCTGCKSEGTDFCPIEHNEAFCCSGLSGQYWMFNEDLGNGTVECCKKDFPSPELECEAFQTVDCNRLLGEYYSDGKECQLQYHMCESGEVCQEGKCVVGESTELPTNETTNTTTTTTTTSTSTTTTTLLSDCNECQTDYNCSSYGSDYICDTGTHCCYNPNLQGAETVTMAIHKGQNIIGGNGLSEADFADCDLKYFKSSRSNCTYDDNGYFIYYDASASGTGDCGSKFFSTSSISPGYGYYLYAGKDCTVTFDRPSSAVVVLNPGQNIISVPVETTLEDIEAVCGSGLKYFKSSRSNCTYDDNGYFIYYDASASGTGDCGSKFFSEGTMRPFVGYYLYYSGEDKCTIIFQDGNLETP